MTEYFYDARDRLDYLIQPDGTRLDYAYDDAGNRTEVKIIRGSETTLTSYGYDTLNRLETVTDANGTTSYTYDDVGNLDTVTYPNGNMADYDYTDVNQLDLLTITDINGNILESYDYGLDQTGRRRSLTEADGRYSEYSYDDLYRLTSETITDAVNGNYSASYQYDWVGNRSYSTIDGVQTSYLYDTNDRLESQGGTSYSYDANGNLKSETLDGNTRSYVYDDRNKLKTLLDNSIEIASYSYNHNGIRIGSTEGATSTSFVVDENRDYAQVLQELESGTTTVDYSYGLDLISQNRGAETRFYQYDGLGSTRQLSDSTGTITDSYDYEAFGEGLNQTGTTENDYRFTGEQYDQGLDQYYLRARYYDPHTARFTQMDSWMGNNSDPQSLHKYTYANVDPVNNTDPTGHFSLMEVGVAQDIRSTLSTMQTDFGFNFLDAAVDPESAASGANMASMGVGAIGGPAAFKLLKLLSGKFRKACNSFDEDTQVWTDEGTRLITDLHIGDKVLAYDEESGKVTLQDVVHLIQREGDYELIQIQIGEETIDATPIHPFYIKVGSGWEWRDAKDLKAEDIVKDKSGNEQSITVINSKLYHGWVYNLTVNNDHTYFVGEQGILAHNANLVCKLNSIEYGAVKPKFGSNPKHMSGSGGQYRNMPKGLEPHDSEYAFLNNSVKATNGKWYAKSSDGNSIYRYFVDHQGVAHWSASTGDKKAPLKLGKGGVPENIVQALGFNPQNGKRIW